MNNKLQAKDLINIGIFTAIYFIVFFTTGMLGYIPVLMLAIPIICPLVAGIPFMLFLTKVNKFGMVTIMGILLSLFMFLTGHPWPILIFGVCFGLLSDIVLKRGNYKNWGLVLVGYAIFSEWIMGLLFPIFFLRESFFASTRDGYGDTYADTLASITPMWVFFLMIAFVALGALLGAFLGKSLLKKHFQRAGIA